MFEINAPKLNNILSIKLWPGFTPKNVQIHGVELKNNHVKKSEISTMERRNPGMSEYNRS